MYKICFVIFIAYIKINKCVFVSDKCVDVDFICESSSLRDLAERYDKLDKHLS